jgi:hypothetical protein
MQAYMILESYKGTKYDHLSLWERMGLPRRKLFIQAGPYMSKQVAQEEIDRVIRGCWDSRPYTDWPEYHICPIELP